MQAVVQQQDCFWGSHLTFKANQLRSVFQAGRAAIFQGNNQFARFNCVLSAVSVIASRQRRGLVQEVTCISDNLVATHFVVTLAFLSTAFFRNDVSAVKSIVQ